MKLGIMTFILAAAMIFFPGSKPAHTNLYQVISEDTELNMDELETALQYRASQIDDSIVVKKDKIDGCDYVRIELPDSAEEYMDSQLVFSKLEFITGYDTNHPQVELDGTNIVKAEAQLLDMGINYGVMVQFDEEGSILFYNMTRNHVGEKISIVMNDEVLSEPVVQMAIEGGSTHITGLDSFAEAKYLAACINVANSNVVLERVNSDEPEAE